LGQIGKNYDVILVTFSVT